MTLLESKMITAYHARYFAHELSCHHRDAGVAKALFNACVQLNPHQVDGALFALRNPLSSGVILADEVGLGKTIEAGLVLCQLWAERRRRLLVVCPAGLRKQWSLELTEKFNLPNVVVDSQAGCSVEQRDRIVILSYEFASARADELRTIAFDLVVMDEAHKLRNIYQGRSVMAQRLSDAFRGRRKILMTATPLQNSLMEIYGLTTILSQEVFGDVASFKEHYTGKNGDIEGLRARLRPLLQRTLRRNVLEYVNYSARQSMTYRFRPSDQEHRLYCAVSDFLGREDLMAIRSQGRGLIEMVVWKLLASSPLAIAGTLEKMRDRLVRFSESLPIDDVGNVDSDIEEFRFAATGSETLSDDQDLPDDEELLTPAQRRQLSNEIEELTRFADWARAITVDTKARALLEAIRTSLEQMNAVGAPQKALIFTESRRTQDYLKNFLDSNGFAGRVVLFNGTNSSPETRIIVDRWIEENRVTGRVSGSRVVDSRTALVEHFRDHATIMVATEAAAEGINLQFCALVMNYDMPWNPQRIEQRIGRCHRYGQKHDVVVINFLNERNRADERVLELLQEKLHLFDGMFGASDEVIGSIEDGVDFEKRILAIYRRCRTTAEIDKAFELLQAEMKPQIEVGLQVARKQLLDHFDQDVHERLKEREITEQASLDRIQQQFWDLTKFVLHDEARFDDAQYSFEMNTSVASAPAGNYRLISKERDSTPSAFLYRMTHSLGEWVIQQGRDLSVPSARLRFGLSAYPKRLTALEPLRGKGGWLTLELLTIQAFDRQESLLFSGMTDDGTSLDQELCEKMFLLGAEVREPAVPDTATSQRLKQESEQRRNAAVTWSLETGSRFFQEECERLDAWVRDKEFAAELKLKETKKLMEEVRKQMRKAATVDEQLALQEEQRRLEKLRNSQRRAQDELEDEVGRMRDRHIEKLKQKLAQKFAGAVQFTIRWEII